MGRYAQELSFEEEHAREIEEATREEERRAAQIAAEKLAAEAGDVSQAAVNQAILKALQNLSERPAAQSGPTPQVPFAKYKHKTPWNPSGEKYRRPLAKTVYLNGHRLRERMLSQDEIDRLNAVKPGVYNNGKWSVVEKAREDGRPEVFIHWPNKTVEQRMDLLGHGTTLCELLDKILAEQTAIRLA